MRFRFIASALIILLGLVGCKKAPAPVASAPASAPTIPPAPVRISLPPIGQELSKNQDFSVIRLDPKALPDVTFADIEGRGKQHRRVEGQTLQTVICDVWHTNVARVDWLASPPGGIYTMILPGATDTGFTTQEVFARAFHEVFHLKIYQKEEEDISVLVLKTPGGRVPSAIAPSDPDEDEFRGTNYSGVTFRGFTIDKFANWIEVQWEGKPVFNETNLPGKYNFVLKGDVITEPESIPTFVRDLGFEEVTETRRMSVVVVEKE